MKVPESTSGARVLALLTRRGVSPRALRSDVPGLSAGHPGCWQVLFLVEAASRLALDLVLRGWEEWGVLSTPRSFHCFPVFHRPSPFFPTAETVCLALGEATCSHVHCCRGLCLWPGHGRSPSCSEGMCVSPQGCGSRGGEVGGGWPEGTRPGEPHLPLPPPAQVGLGSFTLGTPPLTHTALCCPGPARTSLALWVSHPGQSSLWESRPSVPRAQP